MKKNVFAILAIGMLLLSSFAFAPVITGAPPQQPSDGDILYVGGSGPGNYTYIQNAIDNASNGDTIYVYSGTYNENIFIDKQIDLIGEDKENTIINASGIVVNVSADNVNISGFTIKGSTSCTTLQYFDYNNVYWYWSIPDEWGDDYFNMRFTPEGKCKLTTCNFTFYYEDGINGSIVNTTEGVDIIVWDDDGSGFPDTELARVNIHPDDINWWPVNTAVDFTSFNLVFDSDFHIGYTTVNQSEDVYAIISDDGSYGTNRSSEYYDGAWGSMLDDWGVDVNFFITANVSCSGTGIYLPDSDNCRIINNNLKKNKLGINVEESSNNNTIYHNNFKDNYQHAYDNGSNTWDNGTEGNYWDDYTGEDNDGDGIGDTPYNISGGDNQDLYPLMNPYGEEEEPEVIITIEEEEPQNNTSNVDIDLSNVSVYVSIDYNPWPSLIADEGAYCEIGGDNITTTISTAYFPGRKEAPVEGSLEYGTTYNWYVNVSLSLTNVHAWRNETFHFTTEGYNEPPVANFTYNKYGLKVEFNGSISSDPDGSIENYTWDFDDGNYSYIANPQHIFAANGSYNVNLTVRDSNDTTDSYNQTIDVTNARPVVGFDYEPDGKIVTFTSTSYDIDGNLTNITWDFGDGNFSYNVTSPVHTYASENKQYDVTLTVTDNLGLSNSTTQTIKTEDISDPSVVIVKPEQRAVYINNEKKFSRLLGIAIIIGDITVEVNASDEGSDIAKVEFYGGLLGTKLLGNDTTEPFTFKWTRDRIRFFHIQTLKVVAYDNEGNSDYDKMIVRKFL